MEKERFVATELINYYKISQGHSQESNNIDF